MLNNNNNFSSNKHNSIKNDKKICIGANIKRIRKEKKIKGVELIRLVNLQGVELNTFSLSKIEAGTQHITASQFRAIALSLECTYEDLLQEK